MSMSGLDRRLQVLIDDARMTRLEREAERRGSSVATLVREAIDGAFPDDTPTRREAGRLLLDAPPLPVADWAELKNEVEGMYADPSTST